MSLWMLFLLAGISSMAMTWVLRRYALSVSLLDVPNDRSSHVVPTPRGGGAAIVLTFLVAMMLIGSNVVASEGLKWALLGAGTLVSLVGFLDDHGHIAARWRLMGHFIAAGWALIWLNGLPPLTYFGFALDLSWLGHVLAAVYLVWLLNLYNFMDGIDGIAGIEAITVCVGGALVYVVASESSHVVVPIVLSAAAFGFLVWNFPPAKIFMGDAGSGFLGITLGILSLQAAWVKPELFWSWIVLLGVFIVDATITLLRRLLRGEKVYEAHRSHAYQYASRLFGRHLPVTLAVTAINVIWLLPIALWIGIGGLDGALGVLVAFFPLVVLAFRYKAGEKGN